jgi:hypothetical protein
VLREKVALRRLKERDGAAATSTIPAPPPGPAAPQPGPSAPLLGPQQPGGPQFDARRGEKRLASDGSLSPSKRPALQ